jgi:uncharacterized protein
MLVMENDALSYDEALQLIHHYGNGSVWIGHCIAVSRLAARYADIFAAKYALDKDFVRTAALLHDIGRYKTHDPILHGLEGYRLLTGLGHHREAFVCASHILCGLEKDEAVQYGFPEQEFMPRTLEERLIPVCDCLVEVDRPTTLAKRVISITQRYEWNTHFLRRIEMAAERVKNFIDNADREFGISMETIAADVLEPISESPMRPGY